MSDQDGCVISAKVETELRDKIRRLADRNERSFSAEVRVALRSHVAVFDDQREENGDG